MYLLGSYLVVECNKNMAFIGSLKSLGVSQMAWRKKIPALAYGGGGGGGDE